MQSHTYEILLALGILAPLVSFWVLVFFGRRMSKPGAGWFGVVMGMGVPLVLATIVLMGWRFFEDEASRAALSANAVRWTWAFLGDVPVTIGVKLDSLTVAMFFMVTFVAFWIFVFSVGYMSGHSDEVDGRSFYHRFFAYLSLFGFSMLGLVASSSLLFLFIFWELVGLCSYLLIGFYFDKAYASAAAIKAFITNRIGDFGFLVGLMLVFFQLQTLDLDQAAATFAQQHAAGTGIFAASFSFFGWQVSGMALATLMGIGLFCGAMGKSAQFPLHVWLPDAMAGPTPVSALIHAATMVAAGVYLVARVFRLMTPDALLFIAVIGCLTLTLMALVAIVQVDIKKCLAYSTLSQLGYMIFGMGCGAWIAALFHLITHAFFKAMLFLCSGQVIEGCHHEQDMRKMGGLVRKMPVTCWTFFIGVLAISGVGIPGLIGIGGFYSKDEILAVAYARAFDWEDPARHEVHHTDAGHGGDAHAAAPTTGARGEFVLVADPVHGEEPSHGAAGHGPAEADVPLFEDPYVQSYYTGLRDRATIFWGIKRLPAWMFWLALITAYVTPFYMFRCWWMTFMGKPRDEHVHHHAHEIKLMYVPLVVLAVGTFLSGWMLFRPLLARTAPAATTAALVLPTDGSLHTPAIEAAHDWLTFGVGFAFAVGFAIAYFIYRHGLELAERIKRAIWPVHAVLEHKYFFDEVYNLVWVKGCLLVATIARFIDTWIVDFMFDIAAAVTERLAAFSGMILDNHGVDGVVNGVGKTSTDIGSLARAWQTGRIRHYVLFAAATATIVLALILVYSAGPADAAVAATG